MFYSGDEIGTFVADFGSATTRLGLAGEDIPKVVQPSVVGLVPNGDNSATQHHLPPLSFRPNQDLAFPIRDGLVQDWDMLEEILDQALTQNLRINLKGRPVLLAEKPYTHPKYRQKWTELMFEKYQVGGLFLTKDVVLSCYACGKTSGLVVDCGADATVFAPVVDGWVENKGVSRNVVGGRMMDQMLLHQLQRRLSRRPLPLYRLTKEVVHSAFPPASANSSSSATSSSSSSAAGVAMEVARSYENVSLQGIRPLFDAYMTLEMARDAKEASCKVANANLADNESTFVNMPLSQYELPDGTIVDMGLERFQPVELFFNANPLADLPKHDLSLFYPGSNVYESMLPQTVSTPESNCLRQLIETVFKCDAEHQATMLGNIVLTGGASAFEGLPDRVKAEVEAIIHVYSPNARIKTVTNGLAERSYSTWLGGSILGSLGSFHEIWISKADYDEYGAGIVDKKCP